ncbi:condensin complex non-SMC subunit Cnd1, partial [Spiromyces aspiralis]
MRIYCSVSSTPLNPRQDLDRAKPGAPQLRRRGAGKRIESGTLVSETIHGWDNKISELFTAVHELFKLRLARMWRSTPELDSFLEVFTRMANRLLENPAYLKNAQLQDQIFHVFCVCIDSYNKLYNIATIVTQDIQHYDHLADPLAVLLKMCSESYGTPQLADEVLRVMANKEFSTVHDKSGPKNLVGFLVALSEHSPKAMIRQIGLFAHYLDSDSQLMRSAIIEVIGNLIIYLSEQEQVEMTKNQLIEYFDILEQRFSDIHYLVRAKVLQLWGRQVDILIAGDPPRPQSMASHQTIPYLMARSIKAKFPKQRPRLVDLVVKRFHDKTSNVRKNAIRALIALIETHPFIMDG